MPLCYTFCSVASHIVSGLDTPTPCSWPCRTSRQPPMSAYLRILFLTALLSLAGCGHKGPLYLPGQKPPAKSAPADPAAVKP